MTSNITATVHTITTATPALVQSSTSSVIASGKKWRHRSTHMANAIAVMPNNATTKNGLRPAPRQLPSRPASMGASAGPAAGRPAPNSAAIEAPIVRIDHLARSPICNTPSLHC